MALNFDWDNDKSRRHLTKHRATFEEASTIFADPMSVTIENPAHSSVEERFITIGRSGRRQMLVVVHTDREGHIRIISARQATRREKKIYEEGNQN